MIEYEPISKEMHKSAHFKTPLSFGFAQNESTLPIGISELPILSQQVPVVFIKNKDGNFYLSILLSLIPGKNEIIDQDGGWRLPYVPAVLRCYPFAMLDVKNSANERTDQKVLATIKNSPLITNQEEAGSSPIFDASGNLTEHAQKLSQLLLVLEKEKNEATIKISKLLDLDLLTELSTSDKDGQKTVLRDVFSVNNQKLAECSGANLKDLISTNTMDLAYRQMFSFANFKNILKNSGTPDISTRDTVLRVNKEKKASEINTLVQDLLIDD